MERADKWPGRQKRPAHHLQMQPQHLALTAAAARSKLVICDLGSSEELQMIPTASTLFLEHHTCLNTMSLLSTQKTAGNYYDLNV